LHNHPALNSLNRLNQTSTYQILKHQTCYHSVIPLATYRLATGPEMVRPEKALGGMLVIGLPMKDLNEGSVSESSKE
jgi:hypothetical protein